MNRTTTRKGMIVFMWTMIFALSLSHYAFAQSARKITGKVIDDKDLQPIPGAIIKVKGTSEAVSTNTDGEFTIQAKTGDVLVISFLGYIERSVTVGAGNAYNIKLAETEKSLEEVVVIGYGVQKKKLNTGANLQVKGEDIQKQNTTNVLQALQGQTPGVQITSVSGQPGDALSVIIRGKGTISGSGPLYVVDGVQTGDISYLNPADIESVDVLKDGASAAIYGSQSANGVVLVTTKGGKSGQKSQITFDAYFGQQRLANQARLLNSKEYATIMNEAAINSGKQPYFTNDGISSMGTGTNWLGQMFVDQAPTQNYSFGASGGSDVSSYSASLAYTSQQGIVGGKDLSNYERYNIRINSDHKLYKDIVTLGENLTFAYVNNNGIGVGNQYNNTLRNAFNTSPFVQMYDEDGNFFDNSNSDWNNGEANPYAQMYYNNQNRNNNQRLLGNLYLGVEPIKGLRFRTSLGLDYTASEGRSYLPIYKLSIYSFNDNTNVFQGMNKGRALTWDNQVNYSFKLNSYNNFEVMAGTSAYSTDGSGVNASNKDLSMTGLDYAWLDNATNSEGARMSTGGYPYAQQKRMSYFGRVMYNYKEKYLLNATFRADGSSILAPGHRWNFFPSVSGGWVMTNEDFMKNTSWLNFLKLRASWGRTGNQNISPYQYLAPITSSNTNYTFGNAEGTLTPGAYPSRLNNENLTWETSEQSDIGFDATVLNNKLTINADFYIKTTKDWLIQAPILASAGADAPFINGGNVKNSGVELALTYRNHAGSLNYSIGVNGAYNKNKVGAIPTADGIIHGNTNSLYNNSGEFYRAENGMPIGYFWGLKTNGVFQTEEEVNAYKNKNGQKIQPTAQPGDVRYVDYNGDGSIDANDKTMIGNPNPDFTYGFNLAADYKGFDISLQASGVVGNEIVQSWRNQADSKANYSAAILDRWHGAGSSYTTPRVTEDNRNWTQFSDLYIHKGDYLRINNLTLGYDFGTLAKKSYLSKVRLYCSVLNLYTFTSYNGMDPEIGYGEGFSQGVDLGYYPRPRTIMLGANIKF
ncbi:TonB-dependent receptor [Solitalea sp. MAHUQ-68]|uniref:TonB-dependent receptor n=1 Tax=Solitalea agri TaxID=2953739 RepID=A0A9X2EZZ1_9SPHI|nr:TonB-dependent receptor [Solitalea agri]MCO4291575.1 TonB-dependent receptor [Solitalea agri]